MGNNTKDVEFGWYVTFISIVFGVFISVWVQPFESELFGEAFSWNEWNDVLILLRGLITFAILVCLWWWYAIFLGRIDPANGFFMYVYDFSTLASFAVGFRFWDQPNLFPLSVFLGAVSMLGRFFFGRNRFDRSSRDWDAMIIARTVLVLVILSMTGFTVAAFYYNPGTDRQAIEARLAVIHFVVMVLLVAGIIGTVLAVRKAEGWTWGRRAPLNRPADR